MYAAELVSRSDSVIIMINASVIQIYFSFNEMPVTFHDLPFMILNEVNYLILAVRFAWDCDRMFHEGFIKIHLIHFQF